MSAIKMQTPQTYSRLFRPWDSAKTISECENNESNNNKIAIINKKETTKQEFNVNTNIYSANYIYDNGITGNYLIDNYSSETLYAVTNPYNAYFPSDLSSQVPPLPPSAPAIIGVDPLTLTLMEQEYARVMAEDAQIKAINARKQRPKKFKCPHCDVAFSNNGQLKGHIRIHTGERPFKCDLESCGKTFTRNEELTRHKRIHTGIRPFPCTICGKKFGRRDHLKKHMKTHMPQDKQLGSAIFVPMYPYLYGC